MVPLLLLPLLWGGSLQEKEGYNLGVQRLVRVQEGLCVHVPCSFFYPWRSWYSPGKLYTYWYQRRDNTYNIDLVATNNPKRAVKSGIQGRFLLADPRTNNCSLSIRDARKSDTGTYFFEVERGYNVEYTYQDKMLTLHVTDLTQKPDILIQEPLQSGRPTQLTCSLPGFCQGGRPLTFSWVGAAVDSLNHQNLHSSVLIFTPRPRDHGTNLACQVKLQGSSVTTQKTIWLNVFWWPYLSVPDAPWNLTIGVSFRNVTALKIVQDTSLSILEGEALQLLCVADSNPPAQLSWFRGPPALNTDPISSTPILELPRVGTGEEGKFTCQAWHPLGSQSISLSLSVVYPPQLLGPSCSWKDGSLHCSCSSRAQPAPSLRWRLGGALLEGNLSNESYTVASSSGDPWANSSLSLRVGLSAGFRLSFEAENVHGAQSASVLLLPGMLVSVSRVVPAAFGGAGVMALLFLCLCLIFFCIVKNHRRQAAGRQKVTNDEDPVMDTATWGSQQNPRKDGPSDQQLPPGDTSAWREEQDTQYINLRFHGRKPQEPQNKGATSTCVYSEIKKTSQ
ncbi:sialic acid-binding Ig-like lectin 5 isoform X2 [Sturnira hondurensis]|uniref:sialic acid-binding Ig-like lectin 5 isoform X2 n=1 Tax=Sturnira hondurensis TaxID=192404 RepID=UPI001879005C|nr:sialic acid-binding Ig-like lectin 5 isoform X2 [Sturnira hondurensis]